jgi:phytoene desaturase
VLVPVPNQLSGLDWCRLGPAYRSAVLTRLEEVGYQGFADGIEAESVTTPLDWLRQGFAGGTPFGPAHLFRQTGPFRPANLVPGLDNLVLAGCGTQPGVGVPMALLSGGLAARRITGCGR